MAKKRNTNIEMLRIISMLMIVILHFLFHGNVLEHISKDNYTMGFILFLMESICIIAVNIYVLISGYFLSTQKFNIKRILKLLVKVWLYTIIINSLFFLFQRETFSIKNIITTFFPVLTQQYWFINAYLLLVLLTPFLNELLNHMSREKYKLLIILLLFMNSILPLFTASPVSIHSGNSVIWFITLYIIAAYIRKYEIHINKFLMITSYVFITLLTTILASFIYYRYDLSKAMMLYKYNLPFVLIPSILVFLLTVKRKKELKKDRIITFFSSSTLAVYLIHENHFMREFLWHQLISTTKYFSNYFYILYIFAIIAIIFLVCILIDKMMIVLERKICLDSKLIKLGNHFRPLLVYFMKGGGRNT